jgi:hypothetical protein
MAGEDTQKVNNAEIIIEFASDRKTRHGNRLCKPIPRNEETNKRTKKLARLGIILGGNFLKTFFVFF